MRPFPLALLGLMLCAPLGCGKTEEKTEEKTEKTTADVKTQDNQIAQNQNKPNSKAAGPSNSTLPSEFSVMQYIPSEAVVLVSFRPASVLGNELLKNLPKEDFPLEEQLTKAQEELGIDPKTVERITLALWPGKGHAIPRVENRSQKNESRGGKFDKDFDEPKFEFKDDCAVQPGSDEFGDQDFPPRGRGGFDEDAHGGPGGPSIEPPMMDGVVIVQFSTDIDLKALEEKVPAEKADSEHNGIKYRRVNEEGAPAYFMPNSKTVVLTHQEDMGKVLDNKNQSTAVQAALKNGLEHDVAVYALVDSFREQIKGLAGPQLSKADQLIKGTAKFPDQLEGLFLYLDLNQGLDVQLVVDSNAEEASETLQKAYTMGYLAGGQFVAQTSEQAKQLYGEELGGDMARVLQQVYAEAKGEAVGKQFKISLHVPETAVGIIQKLAAAARESAKGIMGLNNLKNIALGAMNYHFTKGDKFPFSTGAEGKLSWRVHLLPYLDNQVLYEQFKLDEAWDSEHNKALLDKMPNFYKLSEGTKPGHTQFVAPAGKGFIFDGDQPRSIASISDGTVNTIMVFSVKPEHAVPWTKPGGFEIDPAKAAEILGGDPQGFLAAFCDGRAQRLDPNMKPETLKALLTVSGGEVIDKSVFRNRTFDRFENEDDIPSFPSEKPEDVRSEKQ